MRVLKKSKMFVEMMMEPEVHRTNLGAIATTSDEEALFRQDASDAGSAVVIKRQKTYGANGDFIDQEMWRVDNAPVIGAAFTDMPDPATIQDGQKVTMTVAGSDLGVSSDDVMMSIVCPAINRRTGIPLAPSGTATIRGAMVSSADPTEVTYQAVFDLSAPTVARLLAGDCLLYVVNTRRMIESDGFPMRMLAR